MKLRVAFSRPKKFNIVSFAIMKFSRCEFSHALLSWRSNSMNTDMVYQASHGMAHFMSGDRFYKDNDIITAYEFELTDAQHLAVMKKCVELAGAKYGTLELLGMGFERLTKIKSPFRDGAHTFVCSELVGEVLRQSGVADVGLDLELAGPKELDHAISLMPEVAKITS